jgi:hypothetical protein
VLEGACAGDVALRNEVESLLEHNTCARGRLGDAPRTLVEDFAKIKSGDVVLKARWSSGREQGLRVRCVTTPDKAQKVLLNRLGLTLPQRLRTVAEVEQM